MVSIPMTADRPYHSAGSLRVIYLGMFGRLSAIPLARLLAAGVQVCGVVVPAPGGITDAPPILRREPIAQRVGIPLIKPLAQQTIVDLAWARAIPVFEISSPGASQTLTALAQLQPDLACVSCFSLRLPDALLRLPPLGFLNIHPSLLPAYRGPAPLFWALRNGERRTGVTVHVMDEGLDTGDIVLQASIDLSDGMTGQEIERTCAELGGQLLLEAIRTLERGTLRRSRQPVGGSYYGWPAPGDFALDTGWPARRAFNFMRGTAEWGYPYLVEVGGQRMALRSALSFAEDEHLGVPFCRSEQEVAIQFTPGVVRAAMELGVIVQ